MEFDETKALDIEGTVLQLPQPGDLYVIRGSGNPKDDKEKLLHNDGYAWINTGNTIPNRNSANYHTHQKTRLDREKYRDCSDKWTRMLFYCHSRNLYALLYTGNNEGVLLKQELKSKVRQNLMAEKQKRRIANPTNPQVTSERPTVEVAESLEEKFAKILSAPRRRRQKIGQNYNQIFPLDNVPCTMQLSQDQIAQMFSENKSAHEKGELPYVNESFIVLPKGGDIFSCQVRKKSGSPQKETDAFAALGEINTDGYRWGKRHLTEESYEADGVQHTIFRIRHYILTDDGYHAVFKRFTYYEPSSGSVIIHYMGDESKAALKPHAGINVNTDALIPEKIYHPTNPRVKAKYAAMFSSEGGTSKQPTAVYSELYKGVPGSDASREMHGPRSARQAAYYKKKFEAERSLKSQREVEKVTKVCEYLMQQKINFVRSFQAIPHNTVLLMTDAAAREFYNSTRTMPIGQYQMLHYDSTYNVSKNWYASILVYRSYTLCSRHEQPGTQDNSAIHPLAVFIHDKRDQISHHQFFDNLTTFMDAQAPKTLGTEKFSEMRKVLVTDREFKNTDIANTEKVFCWNHLRRNVEYKLKSDNIADDPADAQGLKDDFETLLRSRTLLTYQQRRDQLMLSDRWQRNPRWSEYFHNHLNSAVEDHSGRWNLDRLGLVYDPRTGVTNNPAETMNRCIKIFQDSEKFPLHKGILFFKSVLDYYDSLAEAAYHNTGLLKLKEEHFARLKPRANYKGPVIPTADQLLKSVSDMFSKYVTEESGEESPVEIPPVNETSDSDDEPVSAEAKWINSQNEKPTLDTNTGMFIVKGRDGNAHAVQTQPIKYCSCQSPSLCAHVLACMVLMKERPNYRLLPGDVLKKRPVKVPRRKATAGGKAPVRGEHHHGGVGRSRKAGMKYQKRVPQSSDIDSSDADSHLSDASAIGRKRKGVPTGFKPSKKGKPDLADVEEVDEDVEGSLFGDQGATMENLSPGGASYYSPVHLSDHESEHETHKVGDDVEDGSSTNPDSREQTADRRRKTSPEAKKDLGDGGSEKDDETPANPDAGQPAADEEGETEQVKDNASVSSEEAQMSKEEEKSPWEKYGNVKFLYVGDYETYQTSPTCENFNIVCKVPGVATIIKRKETKLSTDDLDLAAVKVSKTVIPNSKTNNINVFVGIRDTKSSNLNEESEKFLKSAEKPPLKKTYDLDCKCRFPVSTENKADRKKMVRCKGKCKKMYHPECFNSATKQNWKCGQCQIVTPGVRWSEHNHKQDGATNTCCIDNFIMALLLHTEINPNLANQLHEAYFKKEGVPIKKILELCRKNQFGNAQTLWLKHMRERDPQIPFLGKGRDIFGSESESILRYLSCANTLFQDYVCTDDDCRAVTQAKQAEFDIALHSTDPLPDQMRLAMEPNIQTPSCTKCGKLTEHIGLNPGNPPAYFFQVITSFNNPEFKQVEAEVPKTMHLNGLKYNLKYVLLSTSHKTHFTSMIYHNNEWFYFNDMAPKNRIRYPIDQDHDDAVVEKLTYFLDDEHLPKC